MFIKESLNKRYSIKFRLVLAIWRLYFIEKKLKFKNFNITFLISFNGIKFYK